MSDILELFKNFKYKYHNAVVKDEALSYEEPWSSLKEKKAQEAWDVSQKAEREFLDKLQEMINKP